VSDTIGGLHCRLKMSRAPSRRLMFAVLEDALRAFQFYRELPHLPDANTSPSLKNGLLTESIAPFSFCDGLRILGN
jgi:hypothetical protein